MPDVTLTLERPAGAALKANTRARLRLVASVHGDAVGFVDGGPAVGFNATAKFEPVDPQADPVVYVATFADVRANDTIASPANTVYEVTVWEPGGSPLEPNYIAVPTGAGPYEVADILATLPTDLSGTRLGDLFDVTTTGAANGEGLIYNSTTGEWEPGATSATVNTLDAVGDVNAPAPTDGQVLTWDSTPGEWVASAPTGGAGVTDGDKGDVVVASSGTVWTVPDLAGKQPLDSDLTAIAALTTTPYGRAFLSLADQAALMALVAAASDTSAGKVELATTTETTTGTDTVRAVTPAGVKAATDALVAGGTALTGLAGPGATLDSDDGVLAYEDGTPVIATPLYLSTVVDTAGAVMNADTSTASMSFVVDEDAMTSDSATKVPTQQSVKAYADTKVAKSLYDAQTILRATTDDTPAALTVGEQTIVGRVTGGNIAALTQAQLLNNLLNGSAMSGDVTISNATGRRIVLKNAQLVNDIALQVFLDNDDTQPAMSIETIIGVAAQIALGPGGSTAPDTAIQRAGAGVVGMSGVQIVPGSSASTQGRVGARIEDVTTGVGNVGTGEDTLTTITLAASTLSATGQAVRARFAGTIANNANAKRIRLKFGTTTLLDTGASGIATGAALDWTGEYTIVRTGAATQKAFAELTLSNGTKFVDYTAPTETLSGALAVFCTGEATSNDDVRCEVMLVDWEGASPQ